MTVRQTVLFLFLCTAGFGEKADDSRPIWLHIDQLCGEIQCEPAYVKIGKVESLFPAPYLTNASLSLYAAGPSDKPCCGEAPIATGQSNKYGDFQFQGLRRGKYWLRVQKDGEEYMVPLQVTSDFNQKTCTDPSVARDLVVNSKPPSIQVRIR